MRILKVEEVFLRKVGIYLMSTRRYYQNDTSFTVRTLDLITLQSSLARVTPALGSASSKWLSPAPHQAHHFPYNARA
jgi:hypothetical protein